MIATAVLVVAIAGCGLALNRIAGFDPLSNPLADKRTGYLPGDPEHDPWQSPTTAPPGMPIPGATITTVRAQLPTEWGVKLQQFASWRYVSLTHYAPLDAKIRIVILTTQPRSDQVHIFDCQFIGKGLKLTADVINELKRCLAAVIPATDQPDAFAWLDKTAPHLTLDDYQRDYEHGNAHLSLTIAPDGVGTGFAYVDRATPTPSS